MPEALGADGAKYQALNMICLGTCSQLAEEVCTAFCCRVPGGHEEAGDLGLGMYSNCGSHMLARYMTRKRDCGLKCTIGDPLGAFTKMDT